MYITAESVIGSGHHCNSHVYAVRQTQAVGYVQVYVRPECACDQRPKTKTITKTLKLIKQYLHFYHRFCCYVHVHIMDLKIDSLCYNNTIPGILRLY